MVQGWALAEQGRYGEGIDRIRQGLRDHLAAGGRLGKGQVFAWLAEAHLKAGSIDEGLAVVEEALGVVGEEPLDVPELLRLRGELLARRGALGVEVESSYREAISAARRLGAKSYELRATTSLARLLGSQRRAREALELLTPLYASFTEGFDTRDLREARALLDELE
jgi:predicted ATPase